MPTIRNIEVEFEVWCGGCGSPMCGNFWEKKDGKFDIEPCQKCLNTARDEGREEVEEFKNG